MGVSAVLTLNPYWEDLFGSPMEVLEHLIEPDTYLRRFP
jgi:hypothetical protein